MTFNGIFEAPQNHEEFDFEGPVFSDSQELALALGASQIMTDVESDFAKLAQANEARLKAAQIHLEHVIDGQDHQPINQDFADDQLESIRADINNQLWVVGHRNLKRFESKTDDKIADFTPWQAKADDERRQRQADRVRTEQVRFQKRRLRAAAAAAILMIGSGGVIYDQIVNDPNEVAASEFSPKPVFTQIADTFEAPDTSLGQLAIQLGIDVNDLIESHPDFAGMSSDDSVKGQNVHIYIEQAPVIKTTKRENISTLADDFSIDSSIIAHVNDLSPIQEIEPGTKLVIPKADIEVIDLPDDAVQLNMEDLAIASNYAIESLYALNPNYQHASRLVVPAGFDHDLIEIAILSAMSPIGEVVPTDFSDQEPGSPKETAPNPELDARRAKLLDVAQHYLAMDIKENPNTPNHSPEIDKYFQMGLTGKNAEWCASTVSRFMQDSGIPFTLGDQDGYKGPAWQVEFVNNLTKEVTAEGGEVWGREVAMHPDFYPQVGDIVIYNKDGKLGDNRSGVNHTGMVIGYNRESGEVTTAEGNFGNALTTRAYNLKAPIEDGSSRSSKVAGILRRHDLHDPNQPIPVPENATVSGEVPGLAFEQLPAQTQEQFNSYRGKIDALKDVYSQVEAQTGVRWEYLAALHYREGGNNPNKSMMAGEPLGSVNPDTGKVEPTELIANGVRTAEHFKGMAKSVYGIDVTSKLDPNQLAHAFLAFNRGSMYKNVDWPASKSPYPMNGYSQDTLNMKFPSSGHYGEGRDWGEPYSVQGKTNKAMGAMVIVSGLGVFNAQAPEAAPATTETTAAPTTTSQPTSTTQVTTTTIDVDRPIELEAGQAWINKVNAMSAIDSYFEDESGQVDLAALEAYVNNLKTNDDGKVLVDVIKIHDELTSNEGDK